MRRLAAILLLVLLAPSAAAQDAGIEAAKRLILAGRLDAAEAALAEAAHDTPDVPEVLFLQAEIATRRGDLDRAIALYRRILVDEPGAARVRLDLARAFFLKGDDRNAEHHFRMALGDRAMPRAAVRNVEAYLAAIEARRRWTFSLALALAPDSNVNTGPARRQVTIGGLPFDLSEDARMTSGIGFSSLLGGEYRAPVTDRVRLVVGGSLWRVEYAGGNFDDMVLNAYAGPSIATSRGSVTVLATGVRRWYGNTPYAAAPGGELRIDHRLSQRLLVEADIGRRAFRYDDEPFRDGPLTSATIKATYGLTSGSFARLILGASRERADAPPLSNTTWRLGAGYHAELPRGLSAYVEPTVAFTRHDAPDFFFGTVRRDQQVRVRTSLSSRRLTYGGFMPVVSYVYTRNASNLDLYDYSRHQILLGVTRQF